MAQMVGALSRIFPRPAHSEFGLFPKVGVLCGKSEQTSAWLFWSRVKVEGAQPEGGGWGNNAFYFLLSKQFREFPFYSPLFWHPANSTELNSPSRNFPHA